ncbi:MAG: thioredoxin family protein [Verrucomicrobia bacterium]|nr:thioredoxin family protein [Verrucomicrobiota bacterium]
MNPLFPIRKLEANCASVPRYRASLASRSASLGLAIAVLMAGTVMPGRAQVVDGRQLVKAQLVADTQHIEPGRKFRLGVLYTIVPKWHIYWKYAGDAGIPTQIEWQLPPGFQAGPLQWPLPTRDQEPGGLEVFDYSNEVLLFTEVQAPEQLPSGPIELAAKSNWLVCEQQCVPGNAQLSLKLNDGGQGPANQDIFTKYSASVPKTGSPPAGYSVSMKPSGSQMVVEFAGVPQGSKLDFFPVPPENVVLNHGKQAGNSVVLSVDGGAALDRLKGVAVIQANGKTDAFDVELQPGGQAAATGNGASADLLGVLQAVAFALIGGLILNVMPCVLPVISLKIFGFVSEAGERPDKAFKLALVFSAGILGCFAILAAIVTFFRAIGAQVGWGFQFQDYRFVLAIACLVFAFALNLFGVFELTVSARATGGLAKLAAGGGYGGAFFQGAFATILATPCTAPFLGTASAFAFTQPAWATFLIFFSIGIGMALPYLLLAIQPKWLRYLPKPGQWMIRLKQLLGFLLLATLLWLSWIVGRLRGVDGMVELGGLLLIIGLLAWIKGSFWTPVSPVRSRVLAAMSMVAVLVVAIGSYLFVTAPSQLSWQAFSQQSLDKALQSGRPVFVDFTADWCITCKANERFALDTSAVRQAFAQNQVVVLRADWTHGDPEITQVLKEHGRAGVPMYLFYPGGKDRPPVVLPELISSQTVLDAMKTGSQTVADARKAS